MLKNKSIAVVIPALNEEVKIKSVIQSIPDFVDIVFVVNDGSIDNTAKVASESQAVVC
ncbi:MAG: glycosyltransferase [Bacteroidales bacterium]